MTAKYSCWRDDSINRLVKHWRQSCLTFPPFSFLQFFLGKMSLIQFWMVRVSFFGRDIWKLHSTLRAFHFHMFLSLKVGQNWRLRMHYYCKLIAEMSICVSRSPKYCHQTSCFVVSTKTFSSLLRKGKKTNAFSFNNLYTEIKCKIKSC